MGLAEKAEKRTGGISGVKRAMNGLGSEGHR